MQVVKMCFAAVPPASLKDRPAAPRLAGEATALCKQCRDALSKSPDGFHFNVELEGFPLVRMEWKAVGQTSGLLTFPPFVNRPNRKYPYLVCLLLNGLETPQDLTALARHAPLPAPLWQEAMNAEKPVAYSFLFVAGRVREPATVTMISAFANTFFGQFGTNEVPDPESAD